MADARRRTPSHRGHLARHADRSRGSGLVATMFGALAFLGFVGLATHVLLGLYATSVLNAVTWDDARRAADQPGPSSTAAAEEDLRRRLSGLRDLHVAWLDDGSGAVGLHVDARRPSVLPPSILGRTSPSRVSRTVWVRAEELR